VGLPREDRRPHLRLFGEVLGRVLEFQADHASPPPQEELH
jgi:hypothetical protein